MTDKLGKKAEALRKIAEEIENCKECKENRIGLPVPGEGNPDADIIFMGEAAGPTESKTGRPFVGRAGKFLSSLLNSIGIKREEVFITSPVKYYPGRRAPNLKEIKHGMIHTSKQIEIINPKLIVMLGNTALKALFPSEKFSVSEVHGKIMRRNDRIYFPTFHPAAAMRFPKIKEKMGRDMKILKDLIQKLKEI